MSTQAELFEHAVRGFFQGQLPDDAADEWTEEIMAIAADHPPSPCPYVVTHGTTLHCSLAESSALRQPVSPSMEPSP